jgi:hypothetical protein
LGVQSLGISYTIIYIFYYVIDEGKGRIMQSQVLDVLDVNGLSKDVPKKKAMLDRCKQRFRVEID